MIAAGIYAGGLSGRHSVGIQPVVGDVNWGERWADDRVNDSIGRADRRSFFVAKTVLCRRRGQKGLCRGEPKPPAFFV